MSEAELELLWRCKYVLLVVLHFAGYPDSSYDLLLYESLAERQQEQEGLSERKTDLTQPNRLILIVMVFIRVSQKH